MFDTMEFLAEGYGTAVRDATVKRRVEETLKRIGGDRPLVTVLVDDDYDDYGGRRPSTSREDLAHLLECLFYDRHCHDCEIDNFADFKGSLDDYYSWGGARLLFVGSPEEWGERELERRRRELEGLASEVAAKHRVRCDSTAFLDAVHEELSSLEYDREVWENPEAKMERYAACMYNGCRDSYFEDNDYVSGNLYSRQRELEEILEWVAEKCPMLWASYCEERGHAE